MDKTTGREAWRVPRDEVSAYATPVIYRSDAGDELITNATNAIRSYDPKTGRLLWQCGGASKEVAPSPITAHGLIYVTSGYMMARNRPLFAIKPGGSGDLTLAKGQTSSSQVAWLQPRTFLKWITGVISENKSASIQVRK